MEESHDPKCSHSIDSHGQGPSLTEPLQQHENEEDYTSKGSNYKNMPRRWPFYSTSTNTLFTFDTKCNTFPARLPLVIKPSNKISEEPELRIQLRPSATPLSSTRIPLSLSDQALSKLGGNPVVRRPLRLAKFNQSLTNMLGLPSEALEAAEETQPNPLETPPNPLETAPPSYSFVLRQMTTPKRPRFIGAFDPSPSFIQRAPPPTYAATFDFYIDAIPPIRRVYSFGFTPMPVSCPVCGYGGLTVVKNKITICTHMWALVLCILCCWVCAPMPYILVGCQEVYHYCRNCGHYLGMYSPNYVDRPSVQIHSNLTRRR